MLGVRDPRFPGDAHGLIWKLSSPRHLQQKITGIAGSGGTTILLRLLGSVLETCLCPSVHDGLLELPHNIFSCGCCILSLGTSPFILICRMVNGYTLNVLLSCQLLQKRQLRSDQNHLRLGLWEYLGIFVLAFGAGSRDNSISLSRIILKIKTLRFVYKLLCVWDKEDMACWWNKEAKH